MTFEEITSGLRKLLLDNNYNPATIRFYEREWNKIQSFLAGTYGDSMFDMERGLAYLENKYSIQTKYNNGTLSQQRVQLMRVVHMLEDYHLHQVLARRYHASKNPIQLSVYYSDLHRKYTDSLSGTELSKSTTLHYTAISQEFMDFLSQKGISDTADICVENCNAYLKTLAGYSFKTVEQKICGIRHFLRFLCNSGYISADIASEIHRPLTLPMPDAVGWAVIDYIKNGRPKYFESDIIFLKHMPPFDPVSDNNHLEQRIVFHMNKAGIRRDKNRHCGFHSLRHSAGSMLLDIGTPLPVITTILGHSDMDVTGIYLKTDLEKLTECVLSEEVAAHERG